MKQYFVDMLYLISCSIHDRTAVLRKDMDFDRIIMEGYGQDCMLWTISALLSAQNKDIFSDADKYKAILIQKSAKEVVRRLNVNKIIKSLDDDSLCPIIIKGESLAVLYPNPLLRESIDTDIFFLTREQCEAACDKMLQIGSKNLYPDRTEKHIVMEHPAAGRMELHYNLYDHDFHQLHLKSEEIIKEQFETIIIKNGFALTTLGKTDSLKFILCHMIEHFLFSRCDIKQIVDILMYVKAYKDLIDWGEFCGFLKSTGYLEVFHTIMGIGIEYLGFEKTALFGAAYEVETVNLFLNDCFNGCTKGVWVNHTVRGLGAVNHKLTQRNMVSQLKVTRNQIRRVLIPKKSLLFKQFAYCSKHRVLLPVAWIHNIAAVLAGMADARVKFRRRARILTRLNMIEKDSK